MSHSHDLSGGRSPPVFVPKFIYSERSGRMTGPVFSYKLQNIVGFWLVEMAISSNQKPTIYRKLYENTGPDNELSECRHIYIWLCTLLMISDDTVLSCRVSSALNSAACVVRVDPASTLVRCAVTRDPRLVIHVILFFPRDPFGVLTSPWVFVL